MTSINARILILSDLDNVL